MRRIPLTLSLTFVVVLVGLCTGTLWTSLAHSSWYDNVAFGPEALAHGRWWTPFTGTFFALWPWQYAPILVFLAVPVGLCEWRIGTLRTAGVFSAGQLVGVVAGGALMLLLRETDWGWAVRTAADLDVGPSAGALAAAMVVSADLKRPWRGRIRFIVLAYVLTSLVYLGFLYDVEHLVAVLAGFAGGPWIAGRRPNWRWPEFTRREIRYFASCYFLFGAILTLIGQFVERDGPFGPIGGDPDSWWWVVILVGLDLLLARGLLRGRRTWWNWAVTLTFLTWGAELVVATAVVFGDADNSGLLWVAILADSSQLVVLLWGRSAFRNPGRRGLRRIGPDKVGAIPSEGDREAARELLEKHGSPNRLSWMTTWEENRWWFSQADAVVAYHLVAGVAVGLCDPISPAKDRFTALDAFIDSARDAGLTPCLFSCSSDIARWAQSQGWIAIQVAEEAIVDLPGLEFSGKKWQDVRSAFNQAKKLQIRTQMLRLAEAPRSIRTQVRAISEEWVHEKGLPEMGFTLGGINEAEDPNVWVNVAVDTDMTVHGVTSWMPIYGPYDQIRGWTLDLMRRLPDGFRYTMELLIASACVEFREQGYEVVSLSGAPLAHAGAADSRVDRGVIDDALARVGDLLEPYYGFKSLQAFKSKFQPRYEPIFLIAADEGVLPRIAIAIGRSYMSNATWRQMLTMTRR